MSEQIVIRVVGECCIPSEGIIHAADHALCVVAEGPGAILRIGDSSDCAICIVIHRDKVVVAILDRQKQGGETIQLRWDPVVVNCSIDQLEIESVGAKFCQLAENPDWRGITARAIRLVGVAFSTGHDDQH